MYEVLMNNDFLKVEYGCPASNLTQEMAPWNKDFTKALNELSVQWEAAIVESINKGKDTGLIKKAIKAEEIAVFVMSGYWGVRNLGKLENSRSVYLAYLKGLKTYFESLQ